MTRRRRRLSVTVSVADIPEVVAIARGDLARLLREVADAEDDLLVARRLRQIADVFDIGQGAQALTPNEPSAG